MYTQYICIYIYIYIYTCTQLYVIVTQTWSSNPKPILQSEACGQPARKVECSNAAFRPDCSATAPCPILLSPDG